MGMKQTDTECDYHVVIIGGGMAGASLACHLASTCGDAVRILLVERFAYPQNTSPKPLYQPSFDARSTALSFGSRKIYHNMGLWDAMAEHAMAIDTIHVSDKGHWGSTTLNAEKEGLEALGYVVENAWLGRVLLHRMQQLPQVTIKAPAQVASIESLSDRAVIHLMQEDGEAAGTALTASLAVIADGVDSALARKLGIHTKVQEYGDSALIANVCFKHPHKGCAYERFTDQGPMALLPLTDSEDGEARASLVWTLPPQEAEELVKAEESVFLQRLQERFGYRQGRFTRVGSRHLYPLKLTLADEQVRQRVVVLGNAAHTLHPVAGQGYNLVLRDIAALSQRLADHFTESGELNADLSELSLYLQDQQADQARTVQFSDYLPKIFTKKSVAIEAGRGLGLVAMDLLPPLQSQFVRFAIGMSGRDRSPN